MAVLQDKALSSAVAATPNLASHVDSEDFGRRESQIQPASLDLTIGEILIPGSEAGKKGSISNPYDQYHLGHGRTAVVRTHETLTLPDSVAAVGFPPSNVSLRGLLMTNPGHVDPGYRGEMSFTVINMGKQPYPLAVGDPIVTLVFMELKAPPEVSYANLKKNQKRPTGGISEELLGVLSHDFLDIEERASTAAKRAVDLAQLRAPIVTAIVAALFAGGLTYIIGLFEPWKPEVTEAKTQIEVMEERVLELEARLGALGADLNLNSFERRIDDLEKKLKAQAE